jgi:hypothetical protein
VAPPEALNPGLPALLAPLPRLDLLEPGGDDSGAAQVALLGLEVALVVA